MSSASQYQNASLLRRVGGIIYDFFLSISFIAVIAALTLFILQANGLKNIQPDSTLSQVLFLYYLFLGFGFFSWFWTHGGQTLGMKAWKLKVLRLDNRPITFWDALARFGLALCLPIISQLWCLIDKQSLALHDRLSGTKLVYIPSKITNNH